VGKRQFLHCKIMDTPDLFTPVRLGAIEAPNRIVMAPLTRMRAGTGRVPRPLMAEYYAQRAAAGLIVNEATAISQQGTGCPNSPGIYAAEQVTGWQRVIEAVHQAGGRIFLQLWHMGRISHPSFQPDGASWRKPKGLSVMLWGRNPSRIDIARQ
jgi:N-ethylmaleimide reductase